MFGILDYKVNLKNKVVFVAAVNCIIKRINYTTSYEGDRAKGVFAQVNYIFHCSTTIVFFSMFDPDRYVRYSKQVIFCHRNIPGEK